jgi:hypothetical protein
MLLAQPTVQVLPDLSKGFGRCDPLGGRESKRL